MTKKYILKNGKLIDPKSNRNEVVDILIVDGMIEKISKKISSTKNETEVDLKNKIIAPGFMDMHVHLREPGFEYKETIATGTLSAAHGGFTSVCCMPNTNPAIDSESTLKFIESQSKKCNNGIVDVYSIAAVTKSRSGKGLSPIGELVKAGAVAFTDDGSPVQSAEVMRRALEYVSMFDLPIIQHCEDLDLARGGVMNEGLNSTKLGLPGIPRVAEEINIARDLILAEYTNAKYHVAHISTEKAVELIRDAKKKKIKATCEVTPHHFVMTDDAVLGFDTNTKMNPPLREKKDVAAMIEGLRDGTIDVIATDHAPHSYDEKQLDFLSAPFGIVGLETAIGLTITELLATKILTIEQIIEKFSVNPRRILNREINISEGERANFTFLDLENKWKVEISKFHSKSKNSPFDGKILTGRSIGIFNNGVLFLS
ncbi:MAG: dihydroorotase [Bacteroidota bacterium]